MPCLLQRPKAGYSCSGGGTQTDPSSCASEHLCFTPMDKICDKDLNNACDRFNPAGKVPAPVVCLDWRQVTGRGHGRVGAGLWLYVRVLPSHTGRFCLAFSLKPVFFLSTPWFLCHHTWERFSSEAKLQGYLIKLLNITPMPTEEMPSELKTPNPCHLESCFKKKKKHN